MHEFQSSYLQSRAQYTLLKPYKEGFQASNYYIQSSSGIISGPFSFSMFHVELNSSTEQDLDHVS